MKDSWIDRLITLLSLLLLASSPVIGGIIFQQTDNFGQALGLALVFLIAGIFASFFTKVWEILNARWAVRFADWIELRLADLFSGYQRQYLNQLVYRCRDFDVEGLNTQGTFALDLDVVYVDLLMAPYSPASPASEIPDGSSAESTRTIWELCTPSKGKLSPQRLALLGTPGSGKTTLVKHVALVIAGSRSLRRRYGMPQKLPVLLFLRDHFATIVANPDLLLSNLLEILTSKWDLAAPKGWFEQALRNGNCMILLDGLDEIADARDQVQVAGWVEEQMKIYSQNDFIVTSRPYGYLRHPIQGLDIFSLLSFDYEQIRLFVQNWYLANEIKSHRKNDEGVHMKAREGANFLIQQLVNDPALMQMAANPLLLTMLSTVHRYRSSLPGRRVELYKEIFEVTLGKRQAAKGMVDDFTPGQKQAVLEHFAYVLMVEKKREMTRDCVLPVLTQELQAIQPECSASVFLQLMENTTNLLVERDNGEVGFAHLTFQEFLASVYVLEHRLEDILIEHVDDLWWHETTLLYAAQIDATSLVKSILKRESFTLSVLMLLIEVKNEARSLDPDVRAQLDQVIAINMVEA